MEQEVNHARVASDSKDIKKRMQESELLPDTTKVKKIALLQRKPSKNEAARVQQSDQACRPQSMPMRDIDGVDRAMG